MFLVAASLDLKSPIYISQIAGIIGIKPPLLGFETQPFYVPRTRSGHLVNVWHSTHQSSLPNAWDWELGLS
jgi:hypothetical protein